MMPEVGKLALTVLLISSSVVFELSIIAEFFDYSTNGDEQVISTASPVTAVEAIELLNADVGPSEAVHARV
tara:strand:- start:886 stop:1098 length:213 start_codon:yes stop_codon:yes gene_type:complete